MVHANRSVSAQKKSRHPGKCEAFIRDPGNALAPHFGSLDSGHCCAMAQQFRNDGKKRIVIPENWPSTIRSGTRIYTGGNPFGGIIFLN